MQVEVALDITVETEQESDGGVNTFQIRQQLPLALSESVHGPDLHMDMVSRPSSPWPPFLLSTC